MLSRIKLKILLPVLLLALIPLADCGSASGQAGQAGGPAVKTRAPEPATRTQDTATEQGQPESQDDGQASATDPEIQNEHLLYERLHRLHIPFIEPREESRFDFNLMRRPLLAFRVWANRPKPFVPSFLFCLIVSSAAWAFMPKQLADAGSFCRKRFWRSLLFGVFATIFAVFSARLLFLTQIGTPLAICVAGALELGMLVGLSVVSSLTGEALLAKLGQSERLSNRPRTKRLLELSVGAIIICALLLIPGLGKLPRIGVRVVLLMCQLGLGGLIYARRVSLRAGSTCDGR